MLRCFSFYVRQSNGEFEVVVCTLSYAFRVCVKHDRLHLRIHFKAVQRKFFFYVQKQFAIFRFGDFIIDFPVVASLNKPSEWHLQNDHKIVQMLQRITFFSLFFSFSLKKKKY